MPNAPDEMARAQEPAIRILGVGKRYRLYSSPQERLMAALTPWKNRAIQEFWALRGLSLDIYPGESIGILGRNGSGKSTLLQLVAGILQPTEGSIEARGRISALLELGSGFNPQLTGRENILIYGNVLGIPTRRILEIFEDIAAFADIGAFIDQPVKNYSSGMLIRLAFAVAVAVQPEILIVDEALAVGDIAFQRKCFRRIEEMREAGLTLLFVTHDPGLVRQLCSKALVLHSGKPVGFGPAAEMADLYLEIALGEGRRAPSAQPSEAKPLAKPSDAQAGIFERVPSALSYVDEEIETLHIPGDRPGACNTMDPVAIEPGKYHLELELAYDSEQPDAVEAMVADWQAGRTVFGRNLPASATGRLLNTIQYQFELKEALAAAEVRVTNLKNADIHLCRARLLAEAPGFENQARPVLCAGVGQMHYYDGKEMAPAHIEKLRRPALAKITTQQGARVLRAALLGTDGQPRFFFKVGDEVLILADVEIQEPMGSFQFGVLVRDRFGQDIFGESRSTLQLGLPAQFDAGAIVRFSFRYRAELRQDTYFITMGVTDFTWSHTYFYGMDLLQLPLKESGAKIFGIANLPHDFEAEVLSRPAEQVDD